MDPRTHLFNRLDSVAAGLRDSGKGLALIGLGSVGRETARLDQYSDLDFFAIVAPGSKTSFLDQLTWLEKECSIAYAFQNTVDGFKVLYQDGVFAEFAVFEPQELATIPYAPGRLVWAVEGINPAIASPTLKEKPNEPPSVDWLIGEALTNLYIGLGRYHRGEKLSAIHFIQGFAVDRVIALAGLLEDEQPGFPDPFVEARRFETRYPKTAQRLAGMLQGYDAIIPSALAILNFLDEHFPINPQMKAAILNLCQETLR